MKNLLLQIRSHLTSHPRLSAALWLAVVSVIAYAPLLFGGKSFIRFDHLTLIYPARQFLAEALHAWRLPYWCDALAFGSAFAANPQHLVFYPPAWLVALFPLPWGIHLLIVLHVFWAGLGTACFSQRLGATLRGSLFAGTVLMLSGYVSSMAEMGCPLMTLAWTPWVALAALRVFEEEDRTERWSQGAILTFMWAMQLLAGDPAGVLTSSLIVLVLFAVRWPLNWRSISVIIAAGLFSLLLTAVLLVPAFYLFRESVRMHFIGSEDSLVWSMHPWRLLQFALPRLLGDPMSTTGLEPTKYLAQVFANTAASKELLPAWAYSEYVGLPVLLLAVAAIRGSSINRRLAIASIFFVLIALGKYTPFYGIYRNIFLPELLVRYPERHIVGALLLWSSLAGLGFRKIFEEAPSKKVLQIAGICTAALFIFWGLAYLERNLLLEKFYLLVDEPLRSSVNLEGALDYVRGGLGAAAISCLLISGVVYYRLRDDRLAVLWSPWIVLVLIAGHLIIESRQLWLICDAQSAQRAPELVNYALAHRDRPNERGVRPRVFRNPDNPTLSLNAIPESSSELSEPFAAAFLETLGQNTAMRFGMAHVPGYEPGANASALVTMLLSAMPMSPQLFDIQWVVARPEKAAAMKEFQRATSMGMGFYEVDGAHRRPRAFFAHTFKWLTDEQSVFEQMKEFGDLETIRLLGRGEDQPQRAPIEPCSVNSPYPERVELTCQSDRPGFVVLLDSVAPGWSASVDNMPAEILRADLLFRAVQVGAGRHQVVFTYTTPGLEGGVRISALAWMLWAGGIYRWRWRRLSKS